MLVCRSFHFYAWSCRLAHAENPAHPIKATPTEKPPDFALHRYTLYALLCCVTVPPLRLGAYLPSCLLLVAPPRPKPSPHSQGGNGLCIVNRRFAHACLSLFSLPCVGESLCSWLIVSFAHACLSLFSLPRVGEKGIFIA